MLKAAFAVIALLAAGAAHAGEITITDPYARSANPRSGAAFMHIENVGPADRLIAARGDVAKRIELHTHIMEDGVARMREVEGGIEIPADGMVMLQRGGLHVMMMGIETPLKQGDSFPLTLVFEQAGEVEVEVTVDNERAPGEMKHKM
jgi:copper(I)-binding protein